MYLLYCSRHPLSWLFAFVIVFLIIFQQQTTPPLEVKNKYEKSTIELSLFVPEDPPPPIQEPEPEPEPQPEPKPQPKPKPQAKPPPPKPTPAKSNTQTSSTPSAPSNPAPAASSQPMPENRATATVDQSKVLESQYVKKLRTTLEQYKNYPTGRKASLERPEGKVEIWLEIDRSGRVLASGILTKHQNMLLNRAATSSLQKISQVAPFPKDAFSGVDKHRFTVTFNYIAP